MKRRILSIILTLALAIAVIPAAFAADASIPGENVTISNVSSESTEFPVKWHEEAAEEGIYFDNWFDTKTFYCDSAPVTVTCNTLVVDIAYLSASIENVPEKIEEVADEDGNIITPGGYILTDPGTYLFGMYFYGDEDGAGYADAFYVVVGAAASATTETPEEDTENTPSSWAAEQVNAAIAEKLVPETLQTKYTQAATRAEFCALAVALYENVKGEITDRKTFTDTNDVNVEKCAAIGVVNGTNAEGTVFSPDAQLTREQAATMLSRLADAVGKPLDEQAASFADNASISEWAAGAVGQMQAAGVMSGVGENTFAPQGAYTREQSIITTMRLFEIVK